MNTYNNNNNDNNKKNNITIIVISFYTKYPVSTIQTPSNSNSNKLLLLFGGLWKVKASYIVLNLNALAKFWNAKGVLKS